MLLGEGAVHLDDGGRFVQLNAFGTLGAGRVLVLILTFGGLQHRIGTLLESNLLWAVHSTVVFTIRQLAGLPTLVIVVIRSCASLKGVVVWPRRCFALGDLLLVEFQQ